MEKKIRKETEWNRFIVWEWHLWVAQKWIRMSVSKIATFQVKFIFGVCLSPLSIAIDNIISPRRRKKRERSELSLISLETRNRWFQITFQFDGIHRVLLFRIHDSFCSIAKSMTEMSINACHILFPRQIFGTAKFSQPNRRGKAVPVAKSLTTGLSSYWTPVQALLSTSATIWLSEWNRRNQMMLLLLFSIQDRM